MQFIGLDIGTTGAKALLVDVVGNILNKCYVGYRLFSDGRNVEQSPNDWIGCGSKAIRDLLEGRDPSKIKALSLSTQGASTVAIDSQNNPIGNAVTWMDSRAISEANELVTLLGADYIYRNTGWQVSPSLDAAKILNMKRSKKYSNAKHFLSTIEYMNMFLTGNPVCDPTNASIRQLYNVTCDSYDRQILEAVGLCDEELPEILPTGAYVGGITSKASEMTGLCERTPVYNGAHDQYCASIGAGAINPGDLLLSAGTTWAVMGICEKLMFTKTYISPALHPVTGRYGAMASLVGTGVSMQWFKDKFTDNSFEEINEQVAISESNVDELFFYPYLSGAGYPFWNLEARGSFTGISLEHSKFDFARAIMEASAFNVCTALNDFTENGFTTKSLYMMGGASKSELWCNLIASASKLSVKISNENEACALGAAIIAAKGSGAYIDFNDAVNAMSTQTRIINPDMSLSKKMSAKYKRYTRMWSCIAQYYENS